MAQTTNTLLLAGSSLAVPLQIATKVWLLPSLVAVSNVDWMRDRSASSVSASLHYIHSSVKAITAECQAFPPIHTIYNSCPAVSVKKQINPSIEIINHHQGTAGSGSYCFISGEISPCNILSPHTGDTHTRRQINCQINNNCMMFRCVCVCVTNTSKCNEK